MTPTVVVPALLSFEVQGRGSTTRQVNLIGVDEATHNQVSDFGHYLQHPANRERLRWDLRPNGYDVHDHQAGPESPPRSEMEQAGWEHRRQWAHRQKELEELHRPGPADRGAPEVGRAAQPPAPADQAPPGEPAPPPDAQADANPFARGGFNDDVQEFDPAKEQHTGAVLGIALASYRTHEGEDRFLVLPGDDIKVMLPTAATPPKVSSDTLTIVDFYESKMSEYDANFVFLPIRRLQELRGMIDPSTGIGNVTSIQIKLRDDSQGALVRDKLREFFPAQLYGVQTWRDKQGALLAAVQMETAILNVLLFLIIAVAGFGILAIFYMIVVEKTRDIGILKSLGAPGRGILGIFLAYGLSLGVVGSGAGLTIGLLFVIYINQIAGVLAMITGHQVFDPAIYYFQSIPTIVEAKTVIWIVAGAMAIAVIASVLPARRAARLHPVEALRYE
jgi:lipoprotein-releasing system permease protein